MANWYYPPCTTGLTLRRNVTQNWLGSITYDQWESILAQTFQGYCTIAIIAICYLGFISLSLSLIMPIHSEGPEFA